MNTRFLGMNKLQFIGIIVAILMAMVALQAWELQRIDNLAARGAQSHQALCVLKADYGRRLTSSEQFLHLSQAQRVQKWGPSLGKIPNATIEQSIRSLQSNIKSLADLDC